MTDLGTTAVTAAEIDHAITRLAREESGRVTALLAVRFGDLDLADDSVQDALLQAVEVWPTEGIPRNPAAWLHTVARNRAIDRLRRSAAVDRRLARAAPELALPPAPAEEVPIVEHSDVGDEPLRLMLLCTHPALDRDTQVALILRLVAGLTTAEIAAGSLISEATLAQRIVRAKRKIRAAGIPLSIPERIDERMGALRLALYLVFNEGYLAHGEPSSADSETAATVVRVDLADEAIRLTEVLRSLAPDDPEVGGLLALQLYHRARFPTRVDANGDLVLLADQDRSRWDVSEIARANGVLRDALDRGRPGTFQLQALIASQHANAVSSSATDWSVIARIYERLSELDLSPVVTLNRAVAVSLVAASDDAGGMLGGPAAALAILDTIVGLDGYHLMHSTRAELLLRLARPAEADAAFERALTLAPSAAERRHLERRRGEVRRLG